jgi:hypothetical protein
LRRLIRRDPGGQARRHDGRQQLRGDADRDRQREQQRVHDRFVQRHVDHEDRRRQRAGDVDQQHRELAQPDLELGVELVGAQPGGDLAELGPRAGGHHDAAAAAGMHDRAHQRAAGQLGQRRPRRHRVGVLVHRHRLAGEHRLVALQPVTASNRTSAGTMSPSRSSTTSPGTNSVTSTRRLPVADTTVS